MFRVKRFILSKLVGTRKYSNFVGKKISDITCSILKENNVNHAFVYNGGAIMSIIDGLHRHKIPFYVNSNEFCVGTSAVGYAKASNRPGVAIVTSGPGITNMVTPITDATNDSTPLVVLSGQVPVTSIGTNAFQECPATEITKSITKWSYCVKDANEFPYALKTAFRIANDGKKGAVHLDIPKCVGSSIFKETNKEIENKFRWIDRMDIKKSCNNDSISIESMYNIIKYSNRPILYIGQGCSDASKELTYFARTLNIPVTTTLHGVGIFNEYYDNSLEMCGMHGSVYANYALQKSDCIIAIGCRFDDRTTGVVDKYAPKAKNILHIEITNKQIGNVINDERYKHIVMDAKKALKKFNELICYQNNNINLINRKNWTKQIAKWKKDFPFIYDSIENKLKTQQVLEKLNTILSTNYTSSGSTRRSGSSIPRSDPGYIITTDVGSHQMWTSQYIKWRKPRTMLSSGSLGCMGVGLPYAIGAKTAYPDKTVIAICGDFSFDMSLNDLRTVKEYNISIKIMVMNDGAQSMVWAWTQYFYEGREAGVLRKNREYPRYADIAKGFGIKSIICDHPDKLEKCIKETMEYEGPILCEFKVEKDKCFPLVKPGCALDEVIYNEDYKPEEDVLAPC